MCKFWLLVRMKIIFGCLFFLVVGVLFSWLFFNGFWLLWLVKVVVGNCRFVVSVVFEKCMVISYFGG